MLSNNNIISLIFSSKNDISLYVSTSPGLKFKYMPNRTGTEKVEINLKRMLLRYQLLYKLGSLQISLVSLAARLANIDVVDIEW